MFQSMGRRLWPTLGGRSSGTKKISVSRPPPIPPASETITLRNLLFCLTVLSIPLVAGAAEPPGAPKASQEAPGKPAPTKKEKAAPDPGILSLTQEMILAFRAERWEDCAGKARKLAEMDPRSFLGPYYLAASFAHLKDEKRGAEWLDRALEANHPQGGTLQKDKDLAWLAASDAGKAVFRRREERIAGRWEGVLRHQRFGFDLPLWDDPARKVASASLKGKVIAVLLIEEHSSEPTSLAATAIQALRDEFEARGFDTVAIHLEDSSVPGMRTYLIERFRIDSIWKGLSVIGAKPDLYPLEVNRWPAVVFIDALGTPRYIEEGYGTSQPSRYRLRITALVEEAEKAARATKAPSTAEPQGSGLKVQSPGNLK